MPTTKFTDDIELHGVKLRLHRIRGFAAFEAKAAWAQIVGTNGAHVLALSSEKLAEMTTKLITKKHLDELSKLGALEYRRSLALVAIVLCMLRDEMTPQSMRLLASHFILGHVEVMTPNGPKMIQQFADLDEALDGSEDGDVWWRLLWHQIPFCLGPSIAVDGTGRASAPTART